MGWLKIIALKLYLEDKLKPTRLLLFLAVIDDIQLNMFVCLTRY